MFAFIWPGVSCTVMAIIWDGVGRRETERYRLGMNHTKGEGIWIPH